MAVRTRPTTQADIARAAGVSRGLVSMALSGSGRMKEDTRAHILEVARALDYHPHAAAAELAGGRSNRLVLILPYLINPFFDALARQLRRAARARGYSLVVLVSELGSAEDIESQTVDEAVAMRPAGLIFAGTSLPSEALAGLAERVTVCTLDRELAEGSVWATRMDEARAARLVMDHLAEQGYRRLFFLGPGPDAHEAIVDERLGHCRAAAAASGIPFEVLADPGAAGAISAVTDSCGRGEAAVVAFNDLVALEAAAAIYQLGWSMGPDLGVVGYDNTAMAARPEFALTSIDQNPARLASLTVQQVLTTPVQSPRTRVVTPSLVVRSSSLRTRL